MSNAAELIETLAEEWSEPKVAIHRGARCPFLLSCSFELHGADASALEQQGWTVPDELREFWSKTSRAVLFKDVQYGQWGIEILSPAESASETQKQSRARPHDFLKRELVVARFLGDAELVVVSCDPQTKDFGWVRVALPLDPRSDWPVVANSFGGFLQQLLEAQGDKYWETSASG